MLRFVGHRTTFISNIGVRQHLLSRHGLKSVAMSGACNHLPKLAPNPAPNLPPAPKLSFPVRRGNVKTYGRAKRRIEVTAATIKPQASASTQNQVTNQEAVAKASTSNPEAENQVQNHVPKSILISAANPEEKAENQAPNPAAEAEASTSKAEPELLNLNNGIIKFHLF